MIRERWQGFFVFYGTLIDWAFSNCRIRHFYFAKHIAHPVLYSPKAKGEVMSILTRIWQDDALHAELKSIMKKHLSILKQFSTASYEHRVEIKKEIERLRQQREQLLKN